MRDRVAVSWPAGLDALTTRPVGSKLLILPWTSAAQAGGAGTNSYVIVLAFRASLA